MSYNLLSGNVNFVGAQQGTIEDLVDTHTVQNITGQKSFTGVLTASHLATTENIFHYGDVDTKISFPSANTMNLAAGGATMIQLYGSLTPKLLALNSAVADIKFNSLGLDTYISGANGRIGIGAVGNYTHALEIAGDVSASLHVSASAFYGKATGITNLSSSAITGLIHPEKILKGTTLTSGSGGLIVNLSAAAGLESTSTGLRWTPNSLGTAGSLASNDFIGIYDVDAGHPKKVTITTLSTTVLGSAAVTSYNGTNTNRVLTSGGGDQIDTEPNLTFNGSLLAVTGAVSSSSTLEIGSHMSGAGDIRIGGDAHVANLNATANITGSNILLQDSIVHLGDTDTHISFVAGGTTRFTVDNHQILTLYGNLATKKVEIENSDFKVQTTGLDFFITSSTGRVGIGVADPDHALEIMSASATQLKLSYDSANSVTLGASSGGDLAITPSGGDISLAGNVSIDGNTTLGNASGDSLTINASTVTCNNGLNFDNKTLVIDSTGNRVYMGVDSGSETVSISGSFAVSGSSVRARLKNSLFQISSSVTLQSGGQTLFEVMSPTNPNILGVTEGGVIASNIQPAAFNANLHISGAAVIGAPKNPISNANLHSGSVTFYLDEGNNKLFFRVKDSIGQVKSGSVNLT